MTTLINPVVDFRPLPSLREFALKEVEAGHRIKLQLHDAKPGTWVQLISEINVRASVPVLVLAPHKSRLTVDVWGADDLKENGTIVFSEMNYSWGWHAIPILEDELPPEYKKALEEEGGTNAIFWLHAARNLK